MFLYCFYDKLFSLQRTLLCFCFPSQSTSGFVFAFTRFLSNVIGGPLMILIQKLFPEER